MLKLSIIVPIFNEGHHLEKVLQHFFRVEFNLPVEWVLVDDCSQDNSSEIISKLIEQYRENKNIAVIQQKKNQGKGAAIQRGIAEATGDLILIQDADFEYDPNEINRLIQPILNQQADVVYGSRFLKPWPGVRRTYHYFANRFLTILSNFLSGIYLTDMETCYKVFRADLLKAMRLRSKRFGFEVEVTAYLAKIRLRMFELPISYYPRTYQQGKKIGWKDGVAAIFHIIRFNYLVSRAGAFNEKLPEKYLRA